MVYTLTLSFDKGFEHSEALYHAAINEFATAGYAAASINTILRNAGMSKGQFYYHFENKQALYFALIEVLIARKAAFMADRTRVGAPDTPADFFTVLGQQIELGLAFARAHPEIEAFSQSFLREQGNPIYAAALARYNLAGDNQLNALIASAHRRGAFRAGLPVDFVQRIVQIVLTNVGALHDLEDPTPLSHRFTLVIQCLKHGLAAENQPSKD